MGAPDRGFPARFGRFELVRRIGQGTYGVVFEAVDPALRRHVALKVLRQTEGADHVRFERQRREAEVLARIRHPHVVTVHEAGSHEGTPYLVMELVVGKTLGEVAREGAPRERLLEIVEQAARGLHAAHEAGALHRDVKPDNILVDASGARVVDFGLARVEDSSLELTRSSATIGSPAYMAPELARSEHDAVGPWTDVYGLGATLYEVLTGETPYADAGSVLELMACLSGQGPDPRPSARAPDVPAALDDLCARALARSPRKRFPDALTFAEALARARGPGGPARRRTAPLVIALALALGVGWLARGRSVPAPVVRADGDAVREARLALDRGDPGAAIAALASAPGEPALRGEALLELGRVDEASSALELARSSGQCPVVLDARCLAARGEPRRAAELLASGGEPTEENLEDALGYLEAAHASDEERLGLAARASGAARTRLEARALSGLGRGREARLLLGEHLEVEPGDGAAHLARAWLETVQGDVAAARSDLATGGPGLASIAVRMALARLDGEPAPEPLLGEARRAGFRGRELARRLTLERALANPTRDALERTELAHWPLARAAAALLRKAPPLELRALSLALATPALARSPDVALWRGRLELQAGGQAVAAKLFDQAESLELQEGDGALREELALARELVGAAIAASGSPPLLADAEAIAERLARLAPGRLGPRRVLARVAAARGDVPEAARRFLTLRALRPAGDPEAVLAIARGGLPLDSPDPAPWLRDRLAAEPGDVGARLALAALLVERGESSEALVVLPRLRAVPSLPWRWRHLALELLANALEREDPEAAATLRQHPFDHDGSGSARASLAVVEKYLAANDPDRAFRTTFAVMKVTDSAAGRALALRTSAVKTPMHSPAFAVELAHRDPQGLLDLVATLPRLVAPRVGASDRDARATRAWVALWAETKKTPRPEALAAIVSSAATLGPSPAARLLGAVARCAGGERRGRVELATAFRLSVAPDAIRLAAARLLLLLGQRPLARTVLEEALSLPFPRGPDAAAALTPELAALAPALAAKERALAPARHESFDVPLPQGTAAAALGLGHRPEGETTFDAPGEGPVTISFWVRRDEPAPERFASLGELDLEGRLLAPSWQLVVVRADADSLELRVDGRSQLLKRPAAFFPLRLWPGVTVDELRLYTRRLDEQETLALEAACRESAASGGLFAPFADEREE